MAARRALVAALLVGLVAWALTGLSWDDFPVPDVPRFGAARAGKAPVKVAIIGGGIAGLSAGHSFHHSNLAKKEGVPEFDFTVLEATHRVGGHSWTVPHPITDVKQGNHKGKTYPVDVGYAYNPTMDSYRSIRQFERRFNINMHGPLHQKARRPSVAPAGGASQREAPSADPARPPATLRRCASTARASR